MLLQFYLNFNEIFDDVTQTESKQDLLIHLLMLSLIRFFIQLVMFWKGCNFLNKIVLMRKLSNNYYVRFWCNLLEYLLLRLIAMKFSNHIKETHTVLVMSSIISTWFIIKYLFIFNNKRSYCKVYH